MNHLTRISLSSLVCLAATSGCVAVSDGAKIYADTEEWQLVYAHDESGERLSGDKQELIEAVRDAKPVRVYFAGRRVEHIADGGFLTIFEGEVFAQMDPIETQAPDEDPVRIEFRDPGTKWHAIIATNGRFTAFSDGGTPNNRQTGAKWFIME